MARKSLADMVPDDLPEDVKIPSHDRPKRPTRKTTTRGRKPAEDKGAQAATDGSESHEDAPDEPATEQAARRPRSASTARTKPAADDGVTYPRRITLPVTDDDYRALNLAKLDDRVDVVNRLRAMIDLWQTNSRIRDQIDRHARRMAR